MKITILLHFLVVLCVSNIFARPQISDSTAKILKYNNDNDGLGSYKFEYETENGISYGEEGKLKPIEEEEEAISASGSYEYTGLKGEIITVIYTADENGYRPKVNIRLLPLAPSRAPAALVASLVG